MDSTKIFTIFAGVNGAGKSTLFRYINKNEYGIRINTDEIVGKNWQNSELQLKAGREAIRIREKAFNENKSLNQETTLTGNGILRAIDKAKELGYKINVFYVGVKSPEIAKERVKERVLNGGHGIPENTIEKRYYESLENLNKIKNKCNELIIYDNSKNFEKIIKIKETNIQIIAENIPKWVKESLDLEIKEQKKERNPWSKVPKEKDQEKKVKDQDKKNPWSKKKNNDRGMER
ncbi:zeta toxin family protein [Cetobacterium sp. ZOR0034]|uniref:zeta toxin family protein n=1 Tax=Cetobacterium sp. ZOR0034 TaxID=1339239 RepID=UPI0009DD8948|nr:zeta toxin family protein [Cetobacterium sp. ZOR0034]